MIRAFSGEERLKRRRERERRREWERRTKEATLSFLSISPFHPHSSLFMSLFSLEFFPNYSWTVTLYWSLETRRETSSLSPLSLPLSRRENWEREGNGMSKKWKGGKRVLNIFLLLVPVVLTHERKERKKLREREKESLSGDFEWHLNVYVIAEERNEIKVREDLREGKKREKYDKVRERMRERMREWVRSYEEWNGKKEEDKFQSVIIILDEKRKRRITFNMEEEIFLSIISLFFLSLHSFSLLSFFLWLRVNLWTVGEHALGVGEWKDSRVLSHENVKQKRWRKQRERMRKDEKGWG